MSSKYSFNRLKKDPKKISKNQSRAFEKHLKSELFISSRHFKIEPIQPAG